MCSGEQVARRSVWSPDPDASVLTHALLLESAAVCIHVHGCIHRDTWPLLTRSRPTLWLRASTLYQRHSELQAPA